MNTTGMSDLIRMSFYDTWAPGRVKDPYDCAKQHPGAAGNTTKYCLQSRFYACAAKLHCPISGLPGSCSPADQTKLANFLPCAENADKSHGPMSRYSDAVPCAEKWGLKTSAILDCAKSKDAVTVIDLVSKATSAAKPAVKFFPDVRVKGKALQDATAKALIKAVCEAYTGNSKPAACGHS